MYFYACILLKIYDPDDINFGSEVNYCLLKTSIENKLSCEAADLESVSLSVCLTLSSSISFIEIPVFLCLWMKERPRVEPVF